LTKPSAIPPTISPSAPAPASTAFRGDAERAFASLEQLRGVLAFYVVIAHSRAILWMGLREATHSGARGAYNAVETTIAYLNMLTRFGNEAVIVFFVLSGFSIAHALRFRPPAARFFFRRFLRLYPVKLVAIGWALAVFTLAIRLAPELLQMEKPYGLRMNFVSPLTILKNISYMPDGELVRPLWSLPHEMFFYVLAPLLTPRPRTFLAVAGVAWLLGVAYFYDLALSLPPTGIARFLVEFVFHYGVLFALGMATYVFYEPLLAFVKQRLRPVLAALAVVGAVALAMQLRFDYGFVNVRDLLTGFFGVALTLLFSQIRYENRLLDRLGRQSYSLYVSHMPTVIALSVILKGTGLGKLVEPRPWIWLLAPPLSVLVAELLFHTVEQPVRRYLERTRQHATPAG
jgi:peptidoglycan/LPS O-acetylase OafA/YrhL